MSNNELRRYSSVVVDGDEQAPSRAMLRAVGFSEDDFQRPQIGIASTWSMVTPCNMHIGGLAEEAAKGANEAGGKGVVFNTISVSDGISMGTPGMRYSLVSREIIADSIEAVAGCRGGLTVLSRSAAVTRICRLASWPWRGLIVHPCLSTEAQSNPVRSGEISSLYSKQLARSLVARSPIRNSWRSSKRLSRDPVPVAACTQPIQWRPPSRHWA